jgi:hypothetical protein
MTPVHRAINSVFFFSVRCDRVLLFIVYRSGLRVDPACHLSAVARAIVQRVAGSRRRDHDAGAPTRLSSEGLYCSRGFLSRGPRAYEAHGEMVRNDGRVDHVDIT